MPALAVKVELGNVRRDDVLVTPAQLLVHDPPFELAPDCRSVRQPDHLPDTHTLVQGEELQLLAQLLVVALLGLLEELHVLVELFRCSPRGSVDACQLRLLLVTTPVRARDTQELEELEILGRAHVWPPAEVDEVARSVKADLIAFDLVVDQLDLVVLAALS